MPAVVKPKHELELEDEVVAAPNLAKHEVKVEKTIPSPPQPSVAELQDERRRKLSNLSRDLKRSVNFAAKKVQPPIAGPTIEEAQVVRQCDNCKVLFSSTHVCNKAADGSAS